MSTPAEQKIMTWPPIFAGLLSSQAKHHQEDRSTGSRAAWKPITLQYIIGKAASVWKQTWRRASGRQKERKIKEKEPIYNFCSYHRFTSTAHPLDNIANVPEYPKSMDFVL